jgi:hypothetical protein
MCHSKILDSFCAEHKTGRRQDPAMPGRREVQGVGVFCFSQTLTILFVRSTKIEGGRTL